MHALRLKPCLLELVQWSVIPHPWSSKGDVRSKLPDGLEADLARMRIPGRRGLIRSDVRRQILEKEARLADPEIYRELLVVPCRMIPLRVAKYDVVFRESSLRAVHAEHTIVSHGHVRVPGLCGAFRNVSPSV